MYGFDWKEHVLAIPSPLVLVTSYKANGKTNATMQSWLTFCNDIDGFYCIFADVNKNGHMYKTLKDKKVAVINFPSLDIYAKCQDTIKNNGYERNEIEESGLTSEKSTFIDAPRIKECFLNLECEYVWEKDIVKDSYHTVVCVKVVNVVMNEEYYNEELKGRYGKTGYLYNIHSPLNPENGEYEETYIGTINKTISHDEIMKNN